MLTSVSQMIPVSRVRFAVVAIQPHAQYISCEVGRYWLIGFYKIVRSSGVSISGLQNRQLLPTWLYYIAPVDHMRWAGSARLNLPYGGGEDVLFSPFILVGEPKNKVGNIEVNRKTTDIKNILHRLRQPVCVNRNPKWRKNSTWASTITVFKKRKII